LTHVFVSYVSADGLFVDRLRARLAEVGFSVRAAEPTRAGGEWHEEIDAALRQAFAVVVVLSRAASSSPFVAYEWACGLGAGADVIPIQVEPTRVHPRLRALGPLDFSDARRAPWDELIGRLRISEATRASLAKTGELGSLTGRERAVLADELASVAGALLDDPRTEAEWLARLLAVLGRLGGAPAVRTLARAMPDSRPDVRYAATDALLALGRTTLPDLQTALTDTDPLLREGAALALARLAPEALSTVGEAAIPALVSALRRDVGPLREVAVSALGRIGKAAVPALLRALDDKSWDVRALAVDALGQLGDPLAVPGLLRILESDDADLRARAASALGTIGQRSALPGLIRALHDRDGVVRWWAAEALGRIGDPAAIAALLEALRRPDEEMGARLTAVRALARIGDPAAVPGLLTLLNDGYWVVREAVARALGEIGDAAAVAGLEQALFDEQPAVREAALEALSRIDSPQARQIVAQFRWDGTADWLGS
jgi:HEAT repeat protein